MMNLNYLLYFIDTTFTLCSNLLVQLVKDLHFCSESELACYSIQTGTLIVVITQ